MREARALALHVDLALRNGAQRLDQLQLGGAVGDGRLSGAVLERGKGKKGGVEFVSFRVLIPFGQKIHEIKNISIESD